MIICQCGIEINQYRIVGSLLTNKDHDREEILTQNSTVPLRLGSRFYALAMIICPSCGLTSFYDLSSPLISDMTETFR